MSMKCETNRFTFDIVTGNKVEENFHNKWPMTGHKMERIGNPADCTANYIRFSSYLLYLLNNLTYYQISR